MPADAGLVALVIAGVVSTIGWFGTLVAWGIMHILTPKPAKTITRAAWLHRAILLIFQSTHVTEVLQCDVMPQGYLVTREKRPRRFLILRPAYKPPEAKYDDEELNKEEQQAIQQHYELANVEDKILRPTTLKGIRVPVYLASAGLAIAFSPEAVLSLQQDKQKVEGYVASVDEEGKVKYVKVDVLLPVNPAKVKKHINMLIDQIDIDAGYDDGVQEGIRTARNPKELKLFMYGGLGMMILGAAMLAISLFLK